jgi:hypothetical protein
MIYLNPKINIIHIIKNEKFTGLDNKTFWSVVSNRRQTKIKAILEEI